MDCLQDVVSAQGPQIANDCIEGLMSTNGMHGHALLITVRRRRCSSPRTIRCSRCTNPNAPQIPLVGWTMLITADRDKINEKHLKHNIGRRYNKIVRTLDLTQASLHERILADPDVGKRVCPDWTIPNSQIGPCHLQWYDHSHRF